MELTPTHRIVFKCENDDYELLLQDIINPVYIYTEGDEITIQDILSIEGDLPEAITFEVTDVKNKVFVNLSGEQEIEVYVTKING